MAVSNREQVGRALDTLAGILDPFIAKVMAPHVPAGHDWTAILEAKDAVKGDPREYEPSDLQAQVRIITERLGGLGFPFGDHLSRAESNLVSEVRDIRNRWAHNAAFSSDDAYRALDTVERVLRAVGAVGEADGVRKSRLDIQRGAYENETRRAVKTAVELPGTPDAELPSWREVLKPHEDVISGRLNKAEFAADLYSVAVSKSDDAEDSEDYSDALSFFRRTYLTEGLKELLRRAVQRVSGDANAQPVINLQTTFGGGKTHSMLAVWHLFSGRPLHEFPQDVQDLFADVPTDVIGRTIPRAAIVGNEFPATGVLKPDGTRVNTLWGELAWQLGGPEAYAIVADADRTSTNPGLALREVFTRFGPAVILVDEWVSYARQLPDTYDDKDPRSEYVAGGLFETQFTFAQALTLAAQAVPGTLLLVSVPASDARNKSDDADVSDLEVGGERGRDALQRLDHVIRRVAYHWTPASREESYEIVRRRLFEAPDNTASATINAAARRFIDYYRRHGSEFPPGVTDFEYESRIKAAYPIHPEFLDRLYADWSTLEKFQRTRGVLRLMSMVVNELWQREDPSPLIMPGAVPLYDEGVRGEVVQYLDHAWPEIVQTDIDGENAVSRAVDKERVLLGNRSLTLRTARAIFLESAPTLDSPVKGKDRKQIALAVAMPGDSLGNLGSALDALQERSSHYYAEDGRYWYDTQPSLNRLAAQRGAHLDIQHVWDEVVARLRRTVKGSTAEFAQFIIAPESTADVPDDDAVRLVVVHPEHVHNGKDKESSASRWVLDLLKHRGAAPRSKPNTVVALAADEKQWTALESAVRSHLAWRSILAEKDRLNLTQSNAAQAESMTETSNRTVDDKISQAWMWGLHAVQEDAKAPFVVGQIKCDGVEKRIGVRASKKFAGAGAVQTEIAAGPIRLDVEQYLLPDWNSGSIAFGKLWDYHTRFPYLQRLANRTVLAEAMRDVLHDPAFMTFGFALATGYDQESGTFAGLAVPLEDHDFGQFTDTTLLVRPDLAVAQRQRERAAIPEPEGSGASSGAGAVVASGGAGTTAPGAGSGTAQPRAVVKNASYSGRFQVDASKDLPSALKEVAEEILNHLRNAGPDVLEITLDVHAERADGFDDSTVRTVRENAGQFGFTRNRFEDS